MHMLVYADACVCRCLSMQKQSFRIFPMEYFMASKIHFLLILLVKFFERDIINGTVSNMK